MNDYKLTTLDITKENTLIFSENNQLFICDIEKSNSNSVVNDYLCIYDIFAKPRFKYLLSNITRISKKDFTYDQLDLTITDEVIYKDDFYQMSKFIDDKIMNKVVWFNKYVFNVSKQELCVMIKNAIKNHSDHLVIIIDKDYVSITNSPELLLKKTDKEIIIDAIAGTSTSKDELSGEKFQEEHNNVISNIHNRISTLTKEFTTGVTKTIPYKKYFHLKTQIKIENKYETENIINTIAPTSAVFGDPFLDVNKNISSFEYYNMNEDSIYAGCMHIKTKTIDKVIVNIRSIFVENNKGTITTGCGLTSDSNYIEELWESKLKKNSVLGLINAGI